MKTLHAYLIAINDYPPPVRKLSGCLNDINKLNEYLKVFAESHEWNYKAYKLLDEKATRQGIIDGFQNLAKAGEDDVCVLAYSGHGSRWAAPEEFWHIEPDKMNESLVCYDSRLPGGRDLMDKELSWLIWKATQGKKNPMIIIMDCCHSGTNVRADYIQERNASTVKQSFPAKDYLGFKDFTEGEKGQYAPPVGKYVQMAACRAGEVAREISSIENEIRGAFSIALNTALHRMGRLLSYAELRNKVGAKVHNLVQNQSPHFEASDPAFINQLFLSEKTTKGKSFYTIRCDRTHGWVVDAGALHGLSPDVGETTFKIKELNLTATVIDVFSSFSKVSGLEKCNKNKVFEAEVEKWAIAPVLIAFAVDIDAKSKQDLLSIIEKKQTDLFKITNAPEKATYWIHTKNNSYFLSLRDDPRPLFQNIKWPERFFEGIETVVNWKRIQEMSNPRTSIKNEDIELEFFRAIETENFEEDAPAEKVDEWWNPIVMPYDRFGQREKLPAFRLKVKNKGKRTIWVSALYLMDDFGIINKLCASEELAPGNEVQLKYVEPKNSITFLTIPLHIKEELRDKLGINTIFEHLKVIISTEKFNSDELTQEGLTLIDNNSRDLGFGMVANNIKKPDWTTFDIELCIRRPIEPLKLPMEKSLFGMEIENIPGFVAAVSLDTFEGTRDDLPLEREGKPIEFNTKIGDHGYFNPFQWTSGRHRSPGLSVVEFHEISGAENISEEQPLVIKATGGFPERVIPFGCNPETGILYELPHKFENGELYLYDLPAPHIPKNIDKGEIASVFLHVSE